MAFHANQVFRHQNFLADTSNIEARMSYKPEGIHK